MHDPYSSSWQVPQKSALITWFLGLLLPSLAFIMQTIPLFVQQHAVLVPAVVGVLFLLASILLFLTSFTNPGVLPMQPFDSARRSFERGEEPPPFVLTTADGVHMEMPVKYCRVCNIVRPPRASHCRETDRCIERWDHFCPWVGTAIGKRNYRPFIAFIVTCVVLGAVVAVGALTHLRLVYAELVAKGSRTAATAATVRSGASATSGQNSLVGSAGSWPGWVQTVVTAPVSCGLLGYGGIASILLSVLLVYHLYLIATNQTTYEHIRGTYDELGSNPFDRGLLSNAWGFLCPSCNLEPKCVPIDLEESSRGRGGECSGDGRRSGHIQKAALGMKTSPAALELSSRIGSLTPSQSLPCSGGTRAVSVGEEATERQQNAQAGV